LGAYWMQMGTAKGTTAGEVLKRPEERTIILFYGRFQDAIFIRTE
jgi:hypothetical protein